MSRFLPPSARMRSIQLEAKNTNQPVLPQKGVTEPKESIEDVSEFLRLKEAEEKAAKEAELKAAKEAEEEAAKEAELKAAKEAEEEAAKEAEEEDVIEVPAFSIALKKTHLKILAQDAGLDDSGTKEDILTRLEDYYRG